MAIKRVVSTDFWQDCKVMDQFTQDDRYFYLYLMTASKSTQVGIYALPKAVIQFETTFSPDEVNSLLQRFEEEFGMIIYNHHTQEIALKNALKHSIMSGGKPLLDLLSRELQQISDHRLIEAVQQHLHLFWQHSQRKIDKHIAALFADEVARRNGDAILLHEEAPALEEGENIDANTCIERYETLYNIITLAQTETIQRLCEELNPALVLAAIEKGKNAKKPFPYILSIIQTYKTKKLRDLYDLKEYEQKYYQNHKFI